VSIAVDGPFGLLEHSVRDGDGWNGLHEVRDDTSVQTKRTVLLDSLEGAVKHACEFYFTAWKSLNLK